MATRVIRVDPEVHEALRRRRRPEDRNWSDVIRRVIRHRKCIGGKS